MSLIKEKMNRSLLDNKIDIDILIIIANPNLIQFKSNLNSKVKIKNLIII
jgi:hypothetical protein